ncbi:MAG TPA: CHRD domain-containing protein [Gaiellaceae bacterium]
MRSPRLIAIACVTGLAVVVAGSAVARTSANRTQLRALMKSSEEVPAPNGDVANARGTFVASATKTATGATLNWTLTFSNLSGNAVAAHIHTGARGQPGPVSVALCGPCTSGATGSAEINATVLSAIQSGGAYINVHTPTNPAGEIRSQLGSIATVRPTLNARQEVPKPKGAAKATGRFTLTAVKTGPSAVITWRLTFSKLTGRAGAAHIHIGRRGVAGGVAVSLCGPCRSGATGRATVSGATLAALEAGRAYVNVHTARNAGGEIRGQIPALPLTITP